MPTFSYDPALDTDLDRVRFAIGDTVEAAMLFPDATITALLTSEGSVNGATLRLAESLVARFAGDRDKKVGALSLSGNRGQFYAALVKQLRQRAALAAVPYVGGISRTDKATQEGDADRVEPKFTKEQFAYPDAGPEPA